MKIDKTTSASVLFVAPQPFYEDRGTPIAIRHTLEALSELGVRVDLLTYPGGQTIEMQGLRTIRVANPFRVRRVPIGLSAKKLILDLSLTPAIFSRIRHGEYRCVHAVEESVFPAIVAAKRRDLPVIYDMQSCLPSQLRWHRGFGSNWAQRTLKGLERRAMAGADRIACSAGLESYVRRIAPGKSVREWHYPGRNVAVSVSEIEKLRHELKIDEDAEVLMYSGNFKAYQNLELFFDAVPEVFRARPKCRVVLVGVHASEDHSVAPAALRDSSRVTIVSRQSRTSLDRYLALADIVVSPRWDADNLPLKIFDYMSAGKPIVAVDSPMNRTILDDDRACLVRPHPEDLANAIIRLLGNRETARGLGEAALEYASRHLSRTIFIAQVAALYSGLDVGSGDASLTGTALQPSASPP